MDERSRSALVVRAILLTASLSNGVIGVWATLSPRGWYDDFPGFGKVWVAVEGPYNEHLVRDVGAWSLALTVLTLAAAWALERRFLIATGVALAVQAAAHAQHHITADNPFDSTGELAQAVSGIVLLGVLGLVVAALAWRPPESAEGAG
jgi:hypothetical protein